MREPQYLDEDVAVGETWEYAVAAIDRAAPPNESATSSPVEVELLAEPDTLKDILAGGADRARSVARSVMAEVRQKTGLTM